MTVREMITRFHGRMDDFNKSYWNEERSKALINELKDKLAQEFTVNRVEQYYEFDSVEGQQEYEVPSTFVAHRYLYFNSSYNQEIKLMDGPENVYGAYADVDIEGIPTRAYIWGTSGRRLLTIYPTFNQDGLTVKWWFYGWPPDVVGDNDEPHLPIEWHPSIVQGMINQAKADDKEISVGDNITLWQMELQKIKKMDATKEFTSKHGQTGTIDKRFPEIGSSSKPDFRIAGGGSGSGGDTGVIW